MFGQGPLHERNFFLTSCGSCGSTRSVKCLLNRGDGPGCINVRTNWAYRPEGQAGQGSFRTKMGSFRKFWDQTFMGIIRGPIRGLDSPRRYRFFHQGCRIYQEGTTGFRWRSER